MNQPPFNHDENLQKAERVAYLIAGHLRGTLTPPEQDELDDWITESDENLELFETLTDEDNIDMAMQRYLATEREKAAALAGVKKRVGLLAKKRPVKRLGLYLTAASLLVAAAGLYLFTRPTSQQPIEKPISQQRPGDVPAGSEKAVLTLSDGRTLILDSSRSGLLANEGGVTIKGNEAGEIVYAGTQTGMHYNVVSTPRGGHYKVVLSDGTQVWLNAESSLRFPAGFASHQRAVELRGEGYFEVATNAGKPFLVTVLTASGDGGTIKVLGTHFNINGYNDEELVKATLLEGSVQVEKNGKTKIISPGEQAVITDNVRVVKVDVAEETAWKNGKFLFRDATIKSIGEQVKRWYDVEVVYQGTVSQHFNTEISRNIPLSRLLEGLEGTGQVTFELKGRTLTIKP